MKVDIINVDIIPGEDSVPEDLAFTWEVSEYSGRSMKLKLVFDKPISISSASDSEQLRIVFKNTDFFYD